MSTNKKEYQREWYQRNKSRVDAKKAKWRAENKDHLQKSRREYIETLNGRARKMFATCKARSIKKKMDFDLDLEWLIQKLENGKCEVTGIDFSIKSGHRKPLSASIDRKNPLKGYTKKNCQMVIFIYNSAKGEFTHEDVLDLAHVLLRIDRVY